MSVASVALAILALGLLIIFHEAGHYWVARFSGMNVSRFSIGFGPAIATFQRGETEFRIGVIPLGGYVQIDGMSPQDGTDPEAPGSYLQKPFHQRFATILAGPVANYLLGFGVFVLFYSAFYAVALAPVRVTEVVDDSPAAAAGLQPGDLIVGAEAEDFETPQDFLTRIQRAQNESAIPILFRIRRGETVVTATLTPENVNGALRIGVGFEPSQMRSAELPFSEAVQRSLEDIWRITHQTVVLFPNLISSLFKEKSQVSGPVGMVASLSRQLERSLVAALRTVGYFSIALGIFNLFPIPALDGSRLLFLLVEAIRRRPIEAHIEQMIHLAGFALLMALILLVTVRDIFG